MVSNASFTLTDLLEEASQRLKVVHKNASIDAPSLSIVWGHTCIFIEEQLVKGKAVLISNLGTFTYIHKKTEIGNKGVKSTKTPVFVVADSFCQNNDVKKDNFANLTTSVPTLTLNYSLIASQSETNRDIVMDFHKEAIRSLGAAIRANRTVAVELKNIGTLVYSSGTLKAIFNSDLVAQIQVFINSPTKNGTSQLGDADIISFNNSLSPPSKLKVNNFLSSPSRSGTPREDYTRDKSANIAKPAVVLPQVDRPKNPMIKIRANSDSALRPLSAIRDMRSLGRPEEERVEKSEEESEKEKEKGEEKEIGRNRGRDTEEDGDGAEEWMERDEREREREKEREKERREREREKERECDDECCEHCQMDQFNARATRLKRAQERAAEDAAMRAQKMALQAIEDKEQMAQRLQKARREEADMHNKAVLGQKQEKTLKQKQMDYYGDIFYARRPDTPESVKRTMHRSSLDEQIVEKQNKNKQKQIEIRKEHEVFHETQKEADERARRLKIEEKQRQKDHAEFLVQQMTQQKSHPSAVSEKFEKFEKSRKTGFEFGAPSEDVYRPSTAERNVKRRSFDLKATENYSETIHQRKQREMEERSAAARDQSEISRHNQELLQHQHQEEVSKKMQTRDLLRSAWDGQMAQKRQLVLSEITQNTSKPQRTSLDLGQLAIERPKHKCKKCGRGISQNAYSARNFRRSSGDFRLSTIELLNRTGPLA